MDSSPRAGQYWTINFFVRVDTVCLAEHTRGPGKGLLNGYGGKGRSLPRDISRVIETYGESRALPLSWEVRARLDFFYDGLHVPTDVAVITSWLGAPRTTTEMRDPRWYAFDKVPYDKMWPDDAHWLPRVLAGERIRGVIRIRDRKLECAPLIWTA